MSVNYYNALLGNLFNDGQQLPLRGGLNFVGFTIVPSQYGYTLTVTGGGGGGDGESEGAAGEFQIADGAGGFLGTDFIKWFAANGEIQCIHPTLGALRVWGVGALGAGDLSWGDPSHATGVSNYYDVGPAKFHVWRTGGTPRVILGGSGTDQATLTMRTTATPAGRPAIRSNVLAPNELTIGDTTDWSVWNHIASGATWGVWNGAALIRVTSSKIEFGLPIDLNSNAITEASSVTFGTGTAPAAGLMRLAHVAQGSGGVVAMTGRTEANDVTVNLLRWNAATNTFQLGDGTSGSGTNGVVGVDLRMRAGGTGLVVSIGGSNRWITTDTQHDARSLPLVGAESVRMWGTNGEDNLPSVGYVRVGLDSGGAVVLACGTGAVTHPLVTVVSSTTVQLGTDVANATAQFIAGQSGWIIDDSADTATLYLANTASYGFSTTGLDFNSRSITELAKLNGATVVAPTEGALTDASATKNISDGAQLVLPASTLSTNRTLTLGTSGSPITGETITVVRHDATANTYAVANGGGGGGTLFTFPASVKGMATFKFDGTNWAWVGTFVRLQ